MEYDWNDDESTLCGSGLVATSSDVLGWWRLAVRFWTTETKNVAHPNVYARAWQYFITGKWIVVWKAVHHPQSRALELCQNWIVRIGQLQHRCINDSIVFFIIIILSNLPLVKIKLGRRSQIIFEVEQRTNQFSCILSKGLYILYSSTWGVKWAGVPIEAAGK